MAKDERLAKRISYAKLVKETYKPTISEKKAAEMEFLKRSIIPRSQVGYSMASPLT